jgi:hypothetical protein
MRMKKFEIVGEKGIIHRSFRRRGSTAKRPGCSDPKKEVSWYLISAAGGLKLC